MKKLTLALLAAGIAVTAACTASSPDALPQGSDQFPTRTETTEAAPVASTCDVTREALLTGTQAEINASMKALMADKTADATAREYADYYLSDGARGATEAQKTSAMLIRTACSI